MELSSRLKGVANTDKKAHTKAQEKSIHRKAKRIQRKANLNKHNNEARGENDKKKEHSILSTSGKVRYSCKARGSRIGVMPVGMKLGVKPSKLAVLDFPSFKQFITYLLDHDYTKPWEH